MPVRNRSLSDRTYNRFKRDAAATRFYKSAAWKKARAAKVLATPVCERCQVRVVEIVHHVKPLAECTAAEAVAQENLQSTCRKCHGQAHGKATNPAPAVPVQPAVTGMLQPVEDDRFTFGADAAEKPIRFIEKFCRHYEGVHAGQPFTLLDWQKTLIRTLFGWKHRTGPRQGMRRFRELYLISAKGAGKTPLLTGIGLYMLLGDGEASAHVVSTASTVEQARLTFDAAGKYINEHPQLRNHPDIVPQQYQIKGPKYGKWTTSSGDSVGRSGSRPSCIIADEVHEWPMATVQGFQMLTANLFKRPNSLLLTATNAAASMDCYARQVHERAMKVLAGTSPDTTLLPAIFEAPAELDWRSEAAARAANPSLGSFITFDQLLPELDKGEARYRRLFLSQWRGERAKWLDLEQWDAATRPVTDADIAGLPCYVGIDPAKVDDLYAVTYVYPSPDRIYVRTAFWLPRATAVKYEQSHGIRYTDWAKAGAIELIDEPTVSDRVQERIAAAVIAAHAKHPIQTVAFDRAYSGGVVEIIRGAGIKCEGIGQGWGIRDGTAELARRLIEQTIVFDTNPVMRFCAQNVEIEHGKYGDDFWPVKPNANGKYAGSRWAKVDGIVSACTALTVARLHRFAARPHVGAMVIDL